MSKWFAMMQPLKEFPWKFAQSWVDLLPFAPLSWLQHYQVLPVRAVCAQRKVCSMDVLHKDYVIAKAPSEKAIGRDEQPLASLWWGSYEGKSPIFYCKMKGPSKSWLYYVKAKQFPSSAFLLTSSDCRFHFPISLYSWSDSICQSYT